VSPISHCTARSSCPGIGIAALDLLGGDLGALHSRKLRSFDEPPVR
jgi:hypothetical protein